MKYRGGMLVMQAFRDNRPKAAARGNIALHDLPVVSSARELT